MHAPAARACYPAPMARTHPDARTLPLLAPLALAAGCGGATEPAPEGVSETLGRVPVVLVVFDALNSEHLGHLGYDRDTSPNLDAFAAEAVSFRHGFSPAPYTLAGIASLLTGKLPDRHGLVDKALRLRDDERTLAEILRDAGYPSKAVVGNPNGGAAFGAADGFDEFVPLYLAGDGREVNYVNPHSGKELHLARAEEFPPHLESFLDGLEDPAAPWFFYGHVLEPHTPYLAPDPWREMFLDPEYAGPMLEGDDDPLIGHLHGDFDLTAEDMQATIDLYDGNIAYADQGFGQLMDVLKQRGLYEDALILVTADHGEAMFQHGTWGHNYSVFDEMVQVPLLVRLPGAADDGRPRGQVRDELVSIMDLVPSVCQWLDLAPPDELDGYSLAPLLAGTEDEATFAERFLHLRTHSTPPTLGLRHLHQKVVVERTKDPEVSELGFATSFYDLVADPEEQSPLLEGEDPRVRAAREVLRAQAAALKASFKGTQDATFTEEEADMMGALGYSDD